MKPSVIHPGRLSTSCGRKKVLQKTALARRLVMPPEIIFFNFKYCLGLLFTKIKNLFFIFVVVVGL